jgi:xanthine dehydrogenase molybdenum-binding subunit
MNTDKAAALPGVRSILRYDDPEVAGVVLPRSFPHENRPYTLLGDIAHYYHQPVGVVICGDNEKVVDEALRLVEIEWDELPFILDWEESLEDGAPLLRPDKNPENNINVDVLTEYGDIEQGFREADDILEFKVVSGEDVWAGVEGMVGVAEWDGEHLSVWQHSQHPSLAHGEMFRQGYTSMDKIKVYSPYNGATLGGITFIGQTEAVLCHAAILAKRTGKPVKALFDQSHFDGSGEKLGSYYFKVGYKNDGSVTALDLTTYNTAQTVHDETIKFHEGTKCKHIRARSIQPFLNRAQAVCYKHGAPACIVQHYIFTHVADALGMDPTVVALVNDGCEGIPMADMVTFKRENGYDPDFDSLKEVLKIGKEAIDWNSKWHAPGTKILPNGKYHGIGFQWVIGWEVARVGNRNTGAIMWPDGKVSVLARRADIGTAPHTTYSQVVADEAGMKYEDVSLDMSQDRWGFEICAPGGSHGLIQNLPGLVLAGRELKKKILELAIAPRSMGRPALFPGKTVEELDIKNSVVFEKANTDNKMLIKDLAAQFMSVGAMGHGNTPIFARVEPPSLSGIKMYVMVRQCYFTEIEVDPDTGQVDVKKVVIVNDVGKVINPDMCNAQQYGGAYMGIGESFAEQVYYDPLTGVKLNDDLLGYPVATILESGPIDCHLLESGLAYTAYGTCGIGESGGANMKVMGPIAVHNAIGKWIDDIPVTPEKILKALGKV